VVLELLTIFLLQSLTAFAQGTEKWEYDFSSRIQMKVTDSSFVFERCDLDNCRTITKKLLRPQRGDGRYNKIIEQVSLNKEYHFVADALVNFSVAPERYKQITYGVSLSPQQFGVYCPPVVTKSLEAAVLKKSKNKSDYIFKFEGQPNDECRTGPVDQPTKPVSEVEAEVKALATLYEKILKKDP